MKRLEASPFPGMDPYLYGYWPEIHTGLITYIRNDLNRSLPEGLVARIEQSARIDSVGREDDGGGRDVIPDVEVRSAARTGAEPAGVAVATEPVAEPVIVPALVRPQRHLTVRTGDGEAITAIEVISPTNKRPRRDRHRYLAKQRDYLDAGLNLVEIDLCSPWPCVLAAPETPLAEVLERGYAVCVTRALIPDRHEVYPAPLQEPLPVVPIPLRPGDDDVTLSLQSLIDRCYRDGRYFKGMYVAGRRAPLPEGLCRWCDQVVADV